MTNNECLFLTSYLIEFMPFICENIIKGRYQINFLKEYIIKVKIFLNEQERNLRKYEVIFSEYNLTLEEKETIKKLQILREKELIYSYRAIIKIEKFIKGSQRLIIYSALKYCTESERAWKTLLSEMCGFIALNLFGRGIKRIF